MSSSNLFNLMEAATALTQLSPPPTQSVSASELTGSSPTSIPPESSPTVPTGISFYMTSSNAHTIPLSTHAISDDDESVRAKMAALRENHLQALRDASGSAVPLSTNGDGDSCVPAPPITAIPHPQQFVTKTKVEKEIFPIRLHRLLADPTVQDAISWLPNGLSFVILRPDAFATSVLPRYFAPEGSNSINAKSSGHYHFKNKAQVVHKYPSFTRKLNRWGFRQVSCGPEAGAFHHDFFRRDNPELCLEMICQKSRKTKKGFSGLDSVDDIASVSSASTITTSTKSGASEGKRPFSATVTVTTASTTANKSLPIKKRRAKVFEDDIPSFVSHRNNSSVPTFNNTMTEFAVTTSPEDASSLISSANVARETLARHFYDQHRSFVLQTLMENSEIAMEAAGIKNQNSSSGKYVRGDTANAKSISPVFGAVTTQPAVIAATVFMSKDKKKTAPIPLLVDPKVTSSEATKNELYQAYISALSSASS